ncbi:MAG: septum formation initiator family protein [Hyphomicrobiaceae bacterium]|nr:septum formation initiator family protein [Hyphomicrobiaceae bacterium]
MRISWQPLSIFLCSVAIAAYFMQTTYSGKYGFEAQIKIKERLSELNRELNSLKSVRLKLQRHIDLLSRVPPDTDILEEIAHRDLGYTYSDELVLYSATNMWQP